MEGGSKIDGLGLNVEKEVMNDSVTETNLVDNRLIQTNHNSNLNEVVQREKKCRAAYNLVQILFSD